MDKFRNILMIFAIILIIVALFYIDFKNLNWSNNSGSYLGIISMIFVIITMVSSNRFEKKQSKNK